MDATTVKGLQERRLVVKGARVRFFVGGSGPPVVLVHGLGGAAANWSALSPLLARGHTVLAPDLPGHGGSSALPSLPTLEALADRVGVVAERSGLLPAAVVGHSLGGLVALRLALRRPDETSALVLAGAAGFSPSTRRAEQALLLATLVRPGRWLAPFRSPVGRSARLRSLALSWGVSDAAALQPEVVESFLAGPGLHTDVSSAARALVLDDVRERLGDLRCSRLVLWGARDRQTPVGDAFEYARRLRARLRVIPDCGHLLIGERPDACADAIIDFLDVQTGFGRSM